MAAATHHPPSSGRLQSRSHTTDGEPVEPFLTSTGILRQAQDERVLMENGCPWRTGACVERVPMENGCPWRTGAHGERVPMENGCLCRTGAYGRGNCAIVLYQRPAPSWRVGPEGRRGRSPLSPGTSRGIYQPQSTSEGRRGQCSSVGEVSERVLIAGEIYLAGTALNLLYRGKGLSAGAV